ncbi:hypothetical protein PWG71_10755 [Nocardiopsis sp. N85]|uniref:hypothetical protein n=1 Tax=Nocardiopsis sp. N85 TaxID=3029400 RepID=UPI00237FC87A|nr:hypothetical protein [Nocardiopsis sp. N85]MDE3721868.1 hypothetical protein [Nocardiopsis sp. N85]
MDANDTAALLAEVAREAGFFAVVEGPGQVDIRGVKPDGTHEGAMRFYLRVQAGELVWRYEFPARPISAPGSRLFNNFPRHPSPADFDRLGWWWRDFRTGPDWQYRPEDWMRPQAWPRWVGVPA